MAVFKKLYTLLINYFNLNRKQIPPRQENEATYRANAVLIAANHDCPFKDICRRRNGFCPGTKQLDHSYWCDWAKYYENLKLFDKLQKEKHEDDKYM